MIIIILIISECLRLCLVLLSTYSTGFEPSVCWGAATENTEMSVSNQQHRQMA
jgi:hypothetical protein